MNLNRDSIDELYGMDSKMDANSLNSSKNFNTVNHDFDSQSLWQQKKNFRSLEPMTHVSKNQIPNLIKQIDEKREKMFMKNRLLLSNNLQP